VQESLMPEVIIVGGGVIGLSLAWELARRGVVPDVFDMKEIGKAASWAGAGLVPPPHRAPDLTDPTCLLRARSADLYPQWSEALREETGIDNGFRVSGGIDVALHPREEPALQSMTGRWRKQGIRFELIDDIRSAELEPELTHSFTRAYYLPERAQVRNPWHLRALENACRRRGARFHTDQPICGLITQGQTVKGIKTSAGEHLADSVVVTAGAWSEGLLDQLGVKMPTRPIKGQMLLLNPGKKLLARIIEHEKCYLVPRDEGLVLAGATEELVGFDESLTTDARSLLWNEAVRLVPALSESQIVKQWCGFRPGSKDSRPYLGKVPGFASLYVATGHQRAGLSLSPATAEVMADLITGVESRISLEGYRIDREPTTSKNDTTRS
jgi:glycine oxidase